MVAEVAENSAAQLAELFLAAHCYAAVPSTFLGLAMSAEAMRSGHGSTGCMPHRPERGAELVHPLGAAQGPGKQQASHASEPAIALHGHVKLEFRMVIETSFRLSLGGAGDHRFTRAKNGYARGKASVRLRAGANPTRPVLPAGSLSPRRARGRRFTPFFSFSGSR